MGRLTAIAFPESSLLDTTFLNTCLIYYDRLVTPQCFLPDLEGLLESADYIDRKLYKVDKNLLVEQYRRTEALEHDLRIFEEAGIVERKELPDVSGDTASTYLSVLAGLLPSPPENLLYAANHTQQWVDGGISFPVQGDDKTNLTGYVMNAVRRTLLAVRHGYQISTGTNWDRRALVQIHRAMIGGDSVEVGRPVLELMRLSLPNLVGKSTEDVLAIREELREFLDTFRLELARIAVSFPSEASDFDLVTEVRQAVDREVRPKINELRSYLRKPGRVLKKYLAAGNTAAVTSAVTLTGSLMTGAPWSTALITAPLVHILSAALQAGNQIQEVKLQNPWTFSVLAEDEAQNV